MTGVKEQCIDIILVLILEKISIQGHLSETAGWGEVGKRSVQEYVLDINIANQLGSCFVCIIRLSFHFFNQIEFKMSLGCLF